MIDLHCDTIMQLTETPSGGDLLHNRWKIDIEKLKKGGYALQDFALYVDLGHTKDPYGKYEQMRHVFNDNMAKYGDYITHVRSYDEFKQAEQDGKLAALLSVEEGGVFGGDLDKLKKAYDDGVRLITISWNYPNGLSYPHGAEHEGKALTPKGEEFVQYMEELGMIVDCSHLNDAGTYRLGEILDKPFIASHSNAREITPHTRNLTDGLIRLIANKGGVIGLNFAQKFLGDSPISRIEDIVRHGLYIRNVGGSDVVALGTDFDGIKPDTEIENAGDMPRLRKAFLDAGLSEADTDKIMYKNANRVLYDLLA